MSAGPRRHRITIQERQETTVNGDRSWLWVDRFVDVPAAWLAGPGREFLAAEAIRAETVGRFETDYISGVTAAMRVLWDGQPWAIKAPPMRDPTARRSMTLMVGAGVNDG